MTIYWTSEDCDGQAILTLHLSVGQVILFPYFDHCLDITRHFGRLPEIPGHFAGLKNMLLCRKIEDQSNSLNSVPFCNISVRPGDHAPFLETHGNSVRLGRSVMFHPRDI